MTQAGSDAHTEGRDELKSRIIARSPFSREETLKIYESYFKTVPRRLSTVLKKYRLSEKSVIDVGCSYGHCLVRFGKGSVGLDTGERNLQFVGAIGLNAIRCNVEQGIPLEDGKYDAAFASHILEHVVSPHQLLVRLSEKLKDSGLIICVMSVLPRSKVFRVIMKDILKYRGAYSSTHYYQFTADTAKYLVERAGFEIIGSFNTTPVHRTWNKIFSVILEGNLANYVIVGKKSEKMRSKLAAGREKNLGS